MVVFILYCEMFQTHANVPPVLPHSSSLKKDSPSSVPSSPLLPDLLKAYGQSPDQLTSNSQFS